MDALVLVGDVEESLVFCDGDSLDPREVGELTHELTRERTGVLIRLLHAIPWEGTVPATSFEELIGLCLAEASFERAPIGGVSFGLDRLVGCGCLLLKAREAGAATGSMSESAVWAADASNINLGG